MDICWNCCVRVVVLGVFCMLCIGLYNVLDCFIVGLGFCLGNWLVFLFSCVGGVWGGLLVGVCWYEKLGGLVGVLDRGIWLLDCCWYGKEGGFMGGLLEVMVDDGFVGW